MQCPFCIDYISALAWPLLWCYFSQTSKISPSWKTNTSKAQDILSPDCRRKNRAHHNYKKNIAVTDCLVILNPAWRHSVIAVFFLYLWWARFCSACSPGLVYLGPKALMATLCEFIACMPGGMKLKNTEFETPIGFIFNLCSLSGGTENEWYKTVFYL